MNGWKLPKGESSLEKGHWGRHEDDDWIDEVQLIEPDGQALLRVVTHYRYKTSGLSGDEWRVGVMWQRRTPAGWEDFDGGYHDIEVALGRLYPGLYTSHTDLHVVPIREVRFLRKGTPIYGSSYEGEARPLLVIAGHLPAALSMARDEPLGDTYKDDSLCLQPGCAEEACSVYRLKHRYCREGHKTVPPWPTFIRFCRKHLRRGDCGLEDADRNYEVVFGPGPDDASGWREHESKSRCIGAVDLGGGDR